VVLPATAALFAVFVFDDGGDECPLFGAMLVYESLQESVLFGGPMEMGWHDLNVEGFQLSRLYGLVA